MIAVEVREFAWNEAPRSGSAEHYWHFLFGYLLPVSRQLSRENPARANMFDCGPVMNEVMSGALQALSPATRVSLSKTAQWPSTLDEALARAQEQDAPEAGAGPKYVVPRWDVWLLHGSETGRLKATLSGAAAVLRDALRGCACCRAEGAVGRYLILRRSAEPSYYQVGGPAQVPTYGAGRRTLRGLEEGAAALERLGWSNLIYEPGAHNLACQIAHFAGCAGVIGVRGAEFANLVWAPAGARVVMIQSAFFRARAAPPLALAELLGLPTIELPHEGEADPLLNAALIAARLEETLDA